MASSEWDVVAISAAVPASQGRLRRGADGIRQSQVVAAMDLAEETVHNLTFPAMMIANLVDAVLDGTASATSREEFGKRCRSLQALCGRTNRLLEELREPATAA